MNFEMPPSAPETSPIENLEKLKKLTKLKFDLGQWKQIMGSAESYDPNRIFYGVPAPDAHLKRGAHGDIMFKEVYDESGHRLGGTITGYPENEKNPSQSEMLTKEQRKLKRAIELLRQHGIEFDENDLDKE